jgi:hypothetical protein
MTATRSGWTAAVRVRNVTGVSAATLACVGGKPKSSAAFGLVRFRGVGLRVSLVAIVGPPGSCG